MTLRRGELFTVLSLSFVNILGFSILIPVLPFIIEQYNVSEVFYGLILSSYAAAQFVGAPLFGSLSDRYGRKPLLFFSHLGTLLSWFVFGAAWFLPATEVIGVPLPILVIIASRVLDGLTGGNISVVSAYVADITEREERATIFGYIGAVVGGGLIIGPAIGGWTAELQYGYLGTVVTAALISAATLLAIIFYVKETKKPRPAGDGALSAVKKRLNIFALFRSYAGRPALKAGLTTKFLFSIAFSAYTSIIALYLVDLFNFDEGGLGTALLVVGSFLILNQVFLVKPAVRHLGERRTVTVGLSLAVLGLFLVSLPETKLGFALLYYPLSLGVSLVLPSLRSYLSMHGEEDEQGALLGADDSLSSLSRAITPVFTATLYMWLGSTVFAVLGVYLATALLYWHTHPVPS